MILVETRGLIVPDRNVAQTGWLYGKGKGKGKGCKVHVYLITQQGRATRK
jgi:hypothetical protein